MVGNATVGYSCIPSKTGNFSIVLQFLALPFHMMMIKVLAKDVHLALPRHRIMLTLSLSDGLQVFTVFFFTVLIIPFQLTTDSMACLVFRNVVIFFASQTLFVSSFAILAMSAERYTACIYSFRLHEIFSDNRVKLATTCLWVGGTAAAIITVSFNRTISNETIIGDVLPLKLLSIISVFPAAIFVTFSQVRLFFFSRSKLRQIQPDQVFGRQAELSDFRKRQMKVALVASIVFAAFIVCMLPMTTVFFYELVTGKNVPTSLKTTCIALAMANTLADPFIYGIGVADTRRYITRDLKKLSRAVADAINMSKNN